MRCVRAPTHAYRLVAGAVNTLSVSEERYFKPSPAAFQRVRGRGKDAWLIRPGSYFLLPYRQAFASEFPADFAIMLTLRPTEESEVSSKSALGTVALFIAAFSCPDIYFAPIFA